MLQQGASGAALVASSDVIDRSSKMTEGCSVRCRPSLNWHIEFILSDMNAKLFSA